MSLSSQQHAVLANDTYENRWIGKRTPDAREYFISEGVKFGVLEHYRNPRNGYAGTIYQRTDTSEIAVAHRGTEAKNIPGFLMDLAYTDGSMVLRRINPQADDAIGSTSCTLLTIEFFNISVPERASRAGSIR